MTLQKVSRDATCRGVLYLQAVFQISTLGKNKGDACIKVLNPFVAKNFKKVSIAQ